MGQQQLLLLVLGAIIVGTAILVGINMFSTSAVQSNQDSITQDVLTIATRFQEHWRKPTQLGGAGQNWQTPEVTFADIGITNTSFDVTVDGNTVTLNSWVNANGAIILADVTDARTLVLEAETREANADGQIYYISYTVTPNGCSITPNSTWTARDSNVQ